MQCQYCGQYLRDDADYCPSCGQTQRAVAPPSPYDPENVNRPQAPGMAPASGYGQSGQPWQGGYAAPPGNYSRMPGATNVPVMTTGQYIGAIILSAIPLVGFILLLVWAFGKKANPNKRNWARAQLIFIIIASVLGIIVWGSALRPYF